MPTITLVKRFTKFLCLNGLTVLVLTSAFAHSEWAVDFSRRQQATRVQDLKQPDPAQTMQFDPPQKSLIDSLFESTQISQEIVVLNTERGFVPANLRLKKGLTYQIHVVNVNEKEKNVSFVLDSFSEHHATYYGKIKSFVIRPQKEGVYKFVSPETSFHGKVVVYPGEAEIRAPASVD